jgi:hypothetical protein
MNTSTRLARKPSQTAHSESKLQMADRPTLKRPEPNEQTVSRGQTRVKDERFVLKIDGQSKMSFAEQEAAFKAGREIKNKFPVVNVSVLDSREGTRELL